LALWSGNKHRPDVRLTGRPRAAKKRRRHRASSTKLSREGCIEILRQPVRRFSALAAKHAHTLLGLCSTSVLVNVTNFGVSAAAIVICTAQVFAAYIVCQAVVQLVTALADGGMAASVQIIAAAERTDAALVTALQRVVNRHALGLGAASVVSIGVLSELSSRFGHRGEVQIPALFLLLSALIGIVQARQNLWAALIYSGGQFKPYSMALLLPNFVRLATLIAMFAAVRRITLPMLLINDLGSASVGWLYSSLWLRSRYAPSKASSPSGVRDLGRQVHALLRSGFVPTFLSSLGLQAVVLSGGVFAAGVALGTFGVFLRASQIIKVVLDPLMSYGVRRLRLVSKQAKRRAEVYFMTVTSAAYILLAGAVFVLYVLAGRFFHHYSLGHGSAFLLFLIVNLFGFLYVAINSLLLSRGFGDHRLRGAILQVVFSLVFVTVVRPSTVWQLCLAQMASVLPLVAYYSWVCLRSASLRPDWDLWMSGPEPLTLDH
jgi:hypothetical protein